MRTGDLQVHLSEDAAELRGAMEEVRDQVSSVDRHVIQLMDGHVAYMRAAIDVLGLMVIVGLLLLWRIGKRLPPVPQAPKSGPVERFKAEERHGEA